jgi:hypothetical protein
VPLSNTTVSVIIPAYNAAGYLANEEDGLQVEEIPAGRRYLPE